MRPIRSTANERWFTKFVYTVVCCMPSVLWRCWFGGRKGIRPVKKMGDGGGGHWLLVRMEWRPSRWSVCLPLLIFPCTINSRSSLLALAHPGGPGKRAVKRLCCGVVLYANIQPLIRSKQVSKWRARVTWSWLVVVGAVSDDGWGWWWCPSVTGRLRYDSGTVCGWQTTHIDTHTSVSSLRTHCVLLQYLGQLVQLVYRPARVYPRGIMGFISTKLDFTAGAEYVANLVNATMWLETCNSAVYYMGMLYLLIEASVDLYSTLSWLISKALRYGTC